MAESKNNIGISNLAQVTTVLVLFVYVTGFIALNTYYSTLGLSMYDILNAQYLSTGVLVLFVFGIFAFMVGRRVVFADMDLAKFRELGRNTKNKKAWELFSLALVIEEMAFGVVVGASIVALLLFANVKELQGIGMLLVFFVMFDYLVMISGRIYDRRPFIALPVVFLIYMGVIVYIIFNARHETLHSFIWYFAVGAFLLNMAVDLKSRIRNSGLVLAMMLVFAFIGATAYFGKHYYGAIKRELGGGIPVRVRMVVSDDFPTSLRMAFRVDKDNMTDIVNIIGESNTELLVAIGTDKIVTEGTFRIRRDIIKAIMPSREAHTTRKLGS